MDGTEINQLGVARVFHTFFRNVVILATIFPLDTRYLGSLVHISSGDCSSISEFFLRACRGRTCSLPCSWSGHRCPEPSWLLSHSLQRICWRKRNGLRRRGPFCFTSHFPGLGVKPPHNFQSLTEVLITWFIGFVFTQWPTGAWGRNLDKVTLRRKYLRLVFRRPGSILNYHLSSSFNLISLNLLLLQKGQ